MKNSLASAGRWEKRWHPLRMEWVVYAAHRNSRPWSFDNTQKPEIPVPYDPSCYLCPGNTRVSGQVNPHYEGVFIFDNDLPVVGPASPDISQTSFHNDLYKKGKAEGMARVVCYHPRHDLTMSNIPLEEVTNVFLALKCQIMEFMDNPRITFVLIFENKGELVGVSNPHPHCQIYATDFVFTLVEKELKAAAQYRARTGRNIFQEIINAEKEDEIRIVAETDGAIAFVPYFARYAYEVMIFPENRHATLATMQEDELRSLAAVFQEVTRRFDINYSMDFPYVMSVLQAPVDRGTYNDYYLHLLIQPPLRQPGLTKYLAGPEIGGGNFMADTMPEEKAAELRAIDPSAWGSLRIF